MLEIAGSQQAGDHLAGNLVTEHESCRRCGATANHVLVGSADVSRDDLEDHRMVDLATMRILKFRIGDVPNLDKSRFDIDHTTVLAHCITPGTVAVRLRSQWIALLASFRCFATNHLMAEKPDRFQKASNRLQVLDQIRFLLLGGIVEG